MTKPSLDAALISARTLPTATARTSMSNTRNAIFLPSQVRRSVLVLVAQFPLEGPLDGAAQYQHGEREPQGKRHYDPVTDATGGAQRGDEPDRGRRGQAGDVVLPVLMQDDPGAEESDPGDQALNDPAHAVRVGAGGRQGNHAGGRTAEADQGMGAQP